MGQTDYVEQFKANSNKVSEAPETNPEFVKVPRTEWEDFMNQFDTLCARVEELEDKTYELDSTTLDDMQTEISEIKDEVWELKSEADLRDEVEEIKDALRDLGNAF